jgi:AcrR family transcriptional regulator
MTKGQETKEKIIEKAAELFNTKGYAASSMNDIMEATGLKKGGIYNHFQSKDEIAAEAFEYAVKRTGGIMFKKISACTTGRKKILVIIEHFESVFNNAPLPGGCPLMNTAIEADNSMPIMRRKVAKAFKQFESFTEKIIQEAIAEGDMKTSYGAGELATLIISTLEGALMLSQIKQSSEPLQIAGKYLKSFLK